MHLLLNSKLHLRLALSRQDLQGFEVRQALKFVEQHPVMSHHLLVRFALLLRRLQLFSLFRLPEHLRQGDGGNSSIPNISEMIRSFLFKVQTGPLRETPRSE